MLNRQVVKSESATIKAKGGLEVFCLNEARHKPQVGTRHKP
ncbi:hypothetical protein CK203_058506 [Vitis vinifera]|uniref:Uncharacterized protein n=1 Tax=Vitis vinifera TaxID=29760 RepID=A0A438FQP0_VITVI|nr:hypothetical protein CK203_058506 [Vitis vinifera]